MVSAKIRAAGANATKVDQAIASLKAGSAGRRLKIRGSFEGFALSKDCLNVCAEINAAALRIAADGAAGVSVRASASKAGRRVRIYSGAARNRSSKHRRLDEQSG